MPNALALHTCEYAQAMAFGFAIEIVVSAATPSKYAKCRHASSVRRVEMCHASIVARLP